jgi:hypothetical protein
MSYSSITAAVADVGLQIRVSTAIQKEAWNSVDFSVTEFAAHARANPEMAMRQLMYPVAIDTEAAYYAAVQAGRGSPGHDPDVITDQAILSAVQAHWIMDEVLPQLAGMVYTPQQPPPYNPMDEPGYVQPPLPEVPPDIPPPEE